MQVTQEGKQDEVLASKKFLASRDDFFFLRLETAKYV